MISNRDENTSIHNQAAVANYHAPKPKTRWTTWAKIIAARILFPPILLWDALKFIVNAMAGNAVSKLVLPIQGNNIPAGFESSLDVAHDLIGQSSFQNTLSPKSLTIETHDGARLDTLHIMCKQAPCVDPKHKQYLINFVGNGMCYEHIIDDMINEAGELKCDVIGFNLRGVNRSTGAPQSKDDLVTDGIAQVQRLLDQGADPENITLKGHSLGAGIATLVADHFHKHGVKVNVFNGRSFSTITNFVVGLIRTGGTSGHEETFGRKILGWLAKPFIKFGLSLVKWEIDAGSAYKNIPETHKEYMVVRSSKSKRNEFGNQLLDDTVISHYASLHASLKDERKAQKERVDQAIESLKHARGDTLINDSLDCAYRELEDAREHLKIRKMTAENKKDNGHNIPTDNLKSRYGNCTGTLFFRDFVGRAHAHHDKSKKPSNPIGKGHTV